MTMPDFRAYSAEDSTAEGAYRAYLLERPGTPEERNAARAALAALLEQVLESSENPAENGRIRRISRTDCE